MQYGNICDNILAYCSDLFYPTDTVEPCGTYERMLKVVVVFGATSSLSPGNLVALVFVIQEDVIMQEIIVSFIWISQRSWQFMAAPHSL